MNSIDTSKIIFKGCSGNWIDLPTLYDEVELIENHGNAQLDDVHRQLNAQFAVMLESRMWGSTILPAITSALIQHCESMKILDFGGGAGKQFAEIIRSIQDKRLIKKIRYYLVELPGYCNFLQPKLEALFPEYFNKKIFFMSSELPENPVDIISCSSSLQYIKNYVEIIAKMLLLRPKLFLIINTPINDKLTYCRTQVNLRVPLSQWVFSIEELDSLFSRNGYKRTFHAIHEHDYLTQDTPSDSVTHQTTLIYTKVDISKIKSFFKALIS